MTCGPGKSCGQPDRPLFRHPALVVAPCKYGHGVFTTEHLPADTTLEECHHLRIRPEDCNGIIDDYVYGLEPDDDTSETDAVYYSLPLGCGSIFNHADDPNTAYWHDTEKDVIVFHTIKAVTAGQQLFIDYGRQWWDSRDCAPDSGR